MSATRRAPGLVALATVWGAVDIALSLYVFASEPAGVYRTMIMWLPYARQALLVSAVIGVLVGGALLVGAFMTHQGERSGLVVLLVAVIVYILSGVGYTAWGFTSYYEDAHQTVSERYRYDSETGRQIENTIVGYAVAVGCTSLVVGVAFLFGIRRAFRRFAATGDQPQPAPVPPVSAVHASASVADEIERLGNLRDRGLLTDDEYRQAKAKLLA